MKKDSRQSLDKPHITKHYRLLDGKAYYKCSTDKWEAYGDTPLLAYEMWKQISSVKEWKAEIHNRRQRPHSSAEWIRESIKEGSKIEQLV